jgi:hypothetical protein
MVVVGTSVNAGRTPRGTLIQSCRFEQINFSGVLINSRSVSLSRSSFSGIADNSNVIMNRDGNLGKNVYGPLNDPATGFADHPGMAFNSGIVIRSQLYVVSQDGRGWMKPSGATSAYSLGDVETSPVIQIIANDFKNLVEGIVGGTLTSFSPGEFSAQIDAVQGQPLVPKLVVRENYFNLISDHAIYFRGRIPEGSTFSKNAFLRVQQVVIKLAGDLSGEERVGSTAVDRSRKYSRFSGPIGSEIKSNYFALCPSYAVTLNGINNRIFDNRIRRSDFGAYL